jgi:formylglycine-generating enzyme required for sulfatase activity
MLGGHAEPGGDGNMPEKQIFLAHAIEDHTQVRALYHLLASLGTTPWMAPECIQGGRQWDPEIRRAIRKSRFAIACLSPHSIQKRGYVQREFRLALDLCAEMPGSDAFLIPLRLQPCHVPDIRVGGISLRDLQWMDAFAGESLVSFLRALGMMNDQYAPGLSTDYSSMVNNEFARGLLEAYGDSCSILTALNPEPRCVRSCHTGGVPTLPPRVEVPSFVKNLEAPLSFVVNSVDGSRLVVVPEGEFLMGDPDVSMVFENQLPSQPYHVVSTHAYMISQHLITNEQFAAFRAQQKLHTAVHFSSLLSSLHYPAELARHPVTNVTWGEAAAYCKWARGRLPTEEEWEKAARGLDGRPFPWGWSEPSAQKCNFGSPSGHTTEVDQIPEGISPFACYDCAGNVWEWTASMNSLGPEIPDIRRHVGDSLYIVKGGSFAHPAMCCRAGGRYYGWANTLSPLWGFRLAADVPR